MDTIETAEEQEAFRAAEAAYWADPERNGLTLVAFRLGWIAGRDWQRAQARPVPDADVARAAAERLLREVEIRPDETTEYVWDLDSSLPHLEDDIQTVARAVLALSAERERLVAALHGLVCNAFGYDKSIVRGLALWAKRVGDPQMVTLAERVLKAEAEAGQVSQCDDVHPIGATRAAPTAR